MHRLCIGGIDEAGRGPLAGPVTAAAVCLPPHYRNAAIGDSKALTAQIREELFPEIISVALAYSVVFIGPREIEQRNILQATRRAMYLAAGEVAAALSDRGETYFLVDGTIRLDAPFRSEPIVKGDSKIFCISAASILAKVARDREMHRLDEEYPGYGLANHKGYGTPEHLRRISELGPCEIHRRTFAGVKEHFA